MDTQFWQTIEVIVIVSVIIVQFIHTAIVNNNIKKLKKVFSNKLFLRTAYVEKDKIGEIELDSKDIYYKDRIDLDEDSLKQVSGKSIIVLSLVDTLGRNPVIYSIKQAINTYLFKNYGAAVNFSIIKDIVDREIDVKDDEITQSVTLPLYLGLAATMIGIIFGLFSMPELEGDAFTEGINALISGVKIAMIGSLTGLGCTTFLSSISYKKARRIVQKDKNDQLTYLQATLLPELIKAEDTGVSGLKASLDRFARVATNISDDVLKAANQTTSNLKLQNEAIEKLNNMNVIKVSKWNLDMFEKLENNMQALENMSQYLTKMDRIVTNLVEFGNKTSDVSKVISSIETTLNESRDLTRFLTMHFEKIESSGDAAMKAVGITESHFEEAIMKLKARTDEMIIELYKSAGNHEITIEEIYKKIGENISGISEQYISSFKEAYTDAFPKFKQLENLELMKEINESLKQMKQNQKLVEKLNSIEDSIKSRPIRSNGGTNIITPVPVQKAEPVKPKEIVTLGEVIKKVF